MMSNRFMEYDVKSWNSSSKDVVGVALITKKCRFVIAPDTINNFAWGEDPQAVENCFLTKSAYEAEFDLNGK